jgi:hypothetical protein
LWGQGFCDIFYTWQNITYYKKYCKTRRAWPWSHFIEPAYLCCIFFVFQSMVNMHKKK